MKVVYNPTFGGFSWPQEIIDTFHISAFGRSREARTDPKIIVALEEILKPFLEKERSNDFYRSWNTPGDPELRILEIPDDCSDWMVTEYDGAETIYFVKEGKLYLVTDDGKYERVNEEG